MCYPYLKLSMIIFIRQYMVDNKKQTLIMDKIRYRMSKSL